MLTDLKERDFESNPAGNYQKDSVTWKILGIDWSKYFPIELDAPCIKAEYSNFNVGMNFIKENYKKIFFNEMEDNRFLSQEISGPRSIYYKNFGDFISFKHNEKIFGIFIGTLTDWSSYYIRSCAMLPDYRGNGRYQRLVIHILNILKMHGVERVEGDISPSNFASIHVHNKLKFNITGFNITDRWGGLIHITKHLSEKSESVFLKQFCVCDFSQKHSNIEGTNA